MTDQLSITEIIIDDPAFHLRDLDAETVRRYAEDIERLPPVEVWRENGSIFLVDGRHRLAVHQERGLAAISVVYYEGPRPEAEARARAANLTHALPLTAAQRRQAREEILERLYAYSNRWLAADFMACSHSTVAALREKLEETGRIPYVDKFKSKDGSIQPRVHRQEAEDEAADGEADLQPPDLTEEEPADNEKDEVTAETGGEAGTRGNDDDGQEKSPAKPTPHNAVVKLAQLGEALAVEVVLYVDDRSCAIPVTLLIAEGPIAGVEEAAPGHMHVLVIGRALAETLRLTSF